MKWGWQSWLFTLWSCAKLTIFMVESSKVDFSHCKIVWKLDKISQVCTKHGLWTRRWINSLRHRCWCIDIGYLLVQTVQASISLYLQEDPHIIMCIFKCISWLNGFSRWWLSFLKEDVKTYLKRGSQLGVLGIREIARRPRCARPWLLPFWGHALCCWPHPPPSSAGQYARQVGGLLASFGYKMWPTSSDGSQFHTSRHSMNTLGLGVSSDYWHSWILRCTAIGGIGEDAVLVRRRGLRSISSEIDFARFQTVFARFWAKLTIFSQQSTSLDFEQSWLKEKVSEVDLKGNRAKLT
jgi:hypothetical protein